MRRASARMCAAAMLAAAAFGLGGCVQWGWKTPQDFLDVYAVPTPTAQSAVLCHAYSCQARREVRFAPKEWREIEAHFAQVSDAAEERQAIARAVASFERMAGRRLGTLNDPGGVINARFSGDPGHLDCVDEALNSTSYLLMLTQRGLVTRHRVMPADIRGIFIDGRWQHYAAVLQESGSGTLWAVDSWIYDNGVEPLIQPLSVWRRS